MTLHISISGEPGCGKTTIAKILAERLGATYISTGLIQRDIASKRGLTTLELNLLAETDGSIDEQIDAHTKSLGNSDQNLVVDSRLAWRFLPASLKVFLVCPLSLAASRVTAQARREETYASNDEAAALLRERYESEKTRFSKYYGAALDNLRNFDLVVDTTVATPQAIADAICQAALARPTLIPIPRVLVSPSSLFPTQDIREVAQVYLSPVREHYGADRLMQGDIDPVNVCHVSGTWGILDGHKRTVLALAFNAPLVPAALCAQNDEIISSGVTGRSFLETSITWSRVYDWEAAFDFSFKSYPDFLRPLP